jgi:hypothetical protein
VIVALVGVRRELRIVSFETEGVRALAPTVSLQLRHPVPRYRRVRIDD